jgi:hypothetical protein
MLYELPFISVVIPSLGRSEKLQTCLRAIELNSGYPEDRYEVIVEMDSFDNRQGAPKTLKAGVEKSKGNLICFLGNDTVPKPGFLFEAVKAMIECFSDQEGLVGFNDEFWDGDLSAHWLVSKNIFNKFFCTGYHHICCDNELIERCKLIGKYTWAEKARIFHDHPEGGGKSDIVYALAYDSKRYAEDIELWKKRSQEFGFPMRYYTKKEAVIGGHTPYDVNLRKRIISLDWNKNIEDYKVLNVGVGDGTGGLAKQLPKLKFKKLDHLDIDSNYLLEAHKLDWQSPVDYIEGNIVNFDFSKYDLVLLFDILEHLPKGDSLKVIDRLKTAIIFIPLEKSFRPNTFDHKSQDHLSLWTEADFKARGFKTEVLPNFHWEEATGWFDSLWATRSSKMPRNEELFTAYYEGNLWGDKETVSGPGSTVEHTEGLGDYLLHIIQKYNIKKILDAPCGDFNWFKNVKIPAGVDYVGADIVRSLVKKNNDLYGRDKAKFIQLDILNNMLPHADLMICRECLQHWPLVEIMLFLDNLLISDVKYLLTTTYEVNENTDITWGDYRPINLQKPPFNFGPPLLVFEEWTWPGTPKKLLMLWEKDKIFKL